jgi:hypothetical protein
MGCSVPVMPAASASAWDDNDFDAARHRAAQAEAARPVAPRPEMDTAPSSRYGAHTLGARMLARPGCQIWTDLDRSRKVDDALGGVLLEIIDTPWAGDGVDPETGEVLTARRTFRCWDRMGKGSYVNVPEAMCGPDSIEGFDDRHAIKAAFQMAREFVARRGPQGTRLIVGHDADLIRHAALLVRSVMGDDR